jgi:Holliday junction resolvase RusA-like endonuclease
MGLVWNPTKAEFVLTGLPLPPSENRLFMNVPTHGKFRGRIKTPEYRQYIADFEAWALMNRLKLGSLRSAFKEQMKLEVEFVMYFAHEAIYCKDGRIKRLDIQNRFKAICDLLAAALGINDSCFFKVSAEKRVSEKECVNIKLKILEIFTELS